MNDPTTPIQTMSRVDAERLEHAMRAAHFWFMFQGVIYGSDDAPFRRAPWNWASTFAEAGMNEIIELWERCLPPACPGVKNASEALGTLSLADAPEQWASRSDTAREAIISIDFGQLAEPEMAAVLCAAGFVGLIGDITGDAGESRCSVVCSDAADLFDDRVWLRAGGSEVKPAYRGLFDPGCSSEEVDRLLLLDPVLPTRGIKLPGFVFHTWAKTTGLTPKFIVGSAGTRALQA